jgi:type IV pilus assembly protein PilA
VRKHHPQGFTLVEIMIVIVIIALLNVMAFPAISNFRLKTQATRVAADFRQMKDGAELALTELGYAPPNGVPSRFPADLIPYLPTSVTSGRKTEKNYFPSSRWAWDNLENRKNRDWKYAIGLRSISSYKANRQIMVEVDRILDDGNINTGYFRKDPWQGYTYILEFHD